MANDDSGEKTEEPTQKKLDDSKKKGQVSKSKDLSSVFVLAAGFLTIGAVFPFIYAKYQEIALDSLRKAGMGRHFTSDEIFHNLYNGLSLVVTLSLPALVAGIFIGGLVEFLQIGPVFSVDPLIPKLEKLNPITGIKNLFSKKQVVELLKNCVKISTSAYIAYITLKDELRLVVYAIQGTPAQIMSVASSIISKLTIRIALLFLVFAIFDLWWQRRVFMKDMMMTKDEIKREYKDSEGDPHNKAKRKEMHQEIIEGAMMDDVANSDVVVTNPDHYAVALKYDQQSYQAPRIVAKGIDDRALQIKHIAKTNGVVEIRNIPLAHALYRLELYKEIPESLYDAVAEVLSFVYEQHQTFQRANISTPTS